MWGSLSRLYGTKWFLFFFLFYFFSFSVRMLPPPFLDSYPTNESWSGKSIEQMLNVSYPRFRVLESAMSFSVGIYLRCFWVEEVIRYIEKRGDEPNVIIIIKYRVSWCSLLLSALFRLQTHLFFHRLYDSKIQMTTGVGLQTCYIYTFQLDSKVVPVDAIRH